MSRRPRVCGFYVILTKTERRELSVKVNLYGSGLRPYNVTEISNKQTSEEPDYGKVCNRHQHVPQ